MIFLRTLFANDDFDWRFDTVVMTERAGGAVRKDHVDCRDCIASANLTFCKGVSD